MTFQQNSKDKKKTQKNFFPLCFAQKLSNFVYVTHPLKAQHQMHSNLKFRCRCKSNADAFLCMAAIYSAADFRANYAIEQLSLQKKNKNLNK